MRLARAIPVLPLLLFLGSTPPVRADNIPEAHELRRAAKLTKKAATALEAGNVARARELYTQTIEITPDFPDAHLGMGHLAMRDNEFVRALAGYERARDGFLIMGHHIYVKELDRYQIAQDKLTPLRGELARVEQQADNNPELAAVFQRRVAQLERVIFQLENIERPDHTEADRVPGEIHFYVGNALINLDRLDEAIEAWETCVRESPAFPLVYNNLAVAYWRKGRVDEALEAVERAESLGLVVHPNLKSDIRRTASGSPAVAGPVPTGN